MRTQREPYETDPSSGNSSGTLGPERDHFIPSLASRRRGCRLSRSFLSNLPPCSQTLPPLRSQLRWRTSLFPETLLQQLQFFQLQHPGGRHCKHTPVKTRETGEPQRRKRSASPRGAARMRMSACPPQSQVTCAKQPLPARHAPRGERRLGGDFKRSLLPCLCVRKIGGVLNLAQTNILAFSLDTPTHAQHTLLEQNQLPKPRRPLLAFFWEKTSPFFSGKLRK